MDDERRAGRAQITKVELEKLLTRTRGEVVSISIKHGQLSVEEGFEEGEVARIPAVQFLQTVKEVAFSTSKYLEPSPVFTGVLFRFDNEHLTLIAADGFRLTQSRIQIDTYKPNREDIIVKAADLTDACKKLFPRDKKNGMSHVRLILRADELLLKQDDNKEQVALQKLGLTYPNYNEMIPAQTEGVTFDKRELLKKLIALKNALGLRDFDWPVRIEPAGSKGLRVWANSESGQRVEGNFVQVIGGNIQSRTAFHAAFLKELLENVRNDTLVLETSTENQQGVFRKAGNSDFVHVLMPRYVNW